ncbi:MAG: hypothetical protein HZC25_01915 [Rhodospirillales bacterium]|nr:hypothetical protein [Rhodospirillales bacterium]
MKNGNRTRVRRKTMAESLATDRSPKSPKRAAALRRLDALMRRGLPLGGGRFDRELAHER